MFATLHKKYAPKRCFARGESFYLMSAHPARRTKLAPGTRAIAYHLIGFCAGCAGKVSPGAMRIDATGVLA